MNPLGCSVVPVFLLPDRHDLFEPVDEVSPRLKRIITMRAAHSHSHADITKFQMSQSVDYFNGADGPLVASFGFQLFHLGLCHFRIGIVIELLQVISLCYPPLSALIGERTLPWWTSH